MTQKLVLQGNCLNYAIRTFTCGATEAQPEGELPGGVRNGFSEEVGFAGP